MASGTTLFQTVVTATPPSGLPIMADSVNDTDHGVGTAQYIKIMDGRTAGTIKAAVTSNGLEVDVKNVQGTVQGLGSFQMVGTAQVLGSVQGVGTFQALGTFQPLAGSVHIASTGTLPLGTVQVLGSVQGVGTFQVLGSVQTVGTSQVLGSVQTVGTSQVLGSVQGVGTFQVLGSVQPVGTAQILGTVRTVVSALTGENFFGTLFTGGVTNGTLVPAPAQGTFVRVFDMIVSGSAAGTAFVEFGDGTAFAPGVFAANGGFVFNSARGVRTHGTSHDILFNAAAGSWGVSVNYSLET